MEKDPSISKESISNISNQKFGTAALEATELSAESKKREVLALYARQYRNAESDFRSEIKESKDKFIFDESGFKEYEDRARAAYSRMQNLATELNLNNDQNRYLRDRLENIANLDNIEGTIEVYSANFYRKRNTAIIEALEKDPDSDKKSAALDNLGKLEYYAADHAKYIINGEELTQKMGVKAYNESRRDSHNTLIGCLNAINDTAIAHDLTPLTFRNFEPNNWKYDETRDPGKYADARATYDRTIVEEYVKVAFTKLFSDKEKAGLSPNRASSTVALFHKLGED